MKKITAPIRLIIGLGNPDPEYTVTYHNIGHQFVLFFMTSQKLCVPENESPMCSMKLLKTDAYMNESGACVAEALKKYGLSLGEILVAQDDADIKIGEWKFSFARNAGGHRGIQNIIDHMGTNAFWRLRIGIRPASAFQALAGEPAYRTGRPAKKWMKAEKLVLKKISAADRQKIDTVFTEALAGFGGF